MQALIFVCHIILRNINKRDVMQDILNRRGIIHQHIYLEWSVMIFIRRMGAGQMIASIGLSCKQVS